MNILEYAREQGCKVIFAGSSSVHSGKLKNPYTFSKVVADDLCLLYKKHFNVDTKICRFYNVYGPHQLTEGEYCTVIGIFERQHKNNEALTITGDLYKTDLSIIKSVIKSNSKRKIILINRVKKTPQQIEQEENERYLRELQGKL